MASDVGGVLSHLESECVRGVEPGAELTSGVAAPFGGDFVGLDDPHAHARKRTGFVYQLSRFMHPLAVRCPPPRVHAAL